MKPEDLDEHPKNWRMHPTDQREKMEDVLEKIGWADAALAYKSERTGRMTLIDGHLRRGLAAKHGDEIPVLVTDLTDAEADAMLAAADPLSEMALRNDAIYRDLLSGLDDGLKELFADIDDLDGSLQELREQEEERPTYDISPEYDEGYYGLIVFARTMNEWAQLATALDLPMRQDSKGKGGMQPARVITAKEFLERWQSR